MEELEKLGISRSLLERLSAREARELLDALEFVLQRYKAIQKESTSTA
jgi:hypothetical protein